VGIYVRSQGSIRIYREAEKLLGAIDGENFRLLARQLGPGEGFDFEMIDLGSGRFVLLSDFSALEVLPAEFEPTPDGRMMLVIQGDPFGIKQ